MQKTFFETETDKKPLKVYNDSGKVVLLDIVFYRK